jgi:hypothetical protein
MRAGLVLACAAVLAACSPSDHPSAPAAPAAAASAAGAPVVAAAPAQPATLARYDGYGDMRFGMDDAAFAQAWGGELKAATPAAGSSCLSKRPLWVKTPADFAFLFEDGHFVRYDVGTAKERAPGGGKVGMGEAQIRSLYGDRVAEQPHKYVDGAKYLRVAAPQGNAMLVFETDATGKVTRWRVGVPPQIDYLEGCG